MGIPSSNTIPGKRDAEMQERSIRQKLDSDEPTYLESLPYEIKKMVATHLEKKEDLKTLSEVSADWKQATLEVINLQNQNAAIDELHDLGNLNPQKQSEISSAIDVYKSFLYDENEDGVNIIDRIEENQQSQLIETLKAISTQQVVERVKALKQACYNDIGLGQASFEVIEEKYSQLKCALILEAFKHIISSHIFSESARSTALKYAVRLGYLEIVKGICAVQDFDYYNECDGLCDAAELGMLDIVKYFLEPGDISKEHKDMALKFAAKQGHLAVVHCLLVHGAQIFEPERGEALKLALQSGRDDIAELLRQVDASSC